jgi:hypothetical protein
MLAVNPPLSKGRDQMRLKLVPAIAATALAISLLGATGASAATEAGNKCAATTTGGPNTWVSTANGPGSPLPPTIPANGIITRWTYNVGIALPPALFSTSLKILRGTGVPKQFQVVTETGFVPINTGTNSFAARIPVRAGDFIGTFGSQLGTPVTLICATGNPADKAAVIESGAPVGSVVTSPGEPEGVQIPLVVFVEPDADNDGFGDETQDACPISAAIQAVACPPVVLSTSTQVKKGSVTVIVTSSAAAPVTVKGVAKLGKGKKVTINGGLQSLIPNTLNKFQLFFPKGLRKKLKELPPKRAVTLEVTVSGTSVTGAVTTQTQKLKLRGQAKPAGKAKPKGKAKG